MCWITPCQLQYIFQLHVCKRLNCFSIWSLLKFFVALFVNTLQHAGARNWVKILDTASIRSCRELCESLTHTIPAKKAESILIGTMFDFSKTVQIFQADWNLERGEFLISTSAKSELIMVIGTSSHFTLQWPGCSYCHVRLDFQGLFYQGAERSIWEIC